MATFMTGQKPHDVQIDRLHSHAICEEIGERLQFAIPPASDRVPSRLLGLTARLDRIERGGVLDGGCDDDALHAAIEIGAKLVRLQKFPGAFQHDMASQIAQLASGASAALRPSVS